MVRIVAMEAEEAWWPPTFSPSAASAAARLTVTDDLPTPPFPEATQ